MMRPLCAFVLPLLLSAVVQAQQARQAGPVSVRSCRRFSAKSASTRISTSRFRSTSAFKDELGESVQIGRYFGAKPVVLNFVYTTVR